jgi:hypothetical protein
LGSLFVDSVPRSQIIEAINGVLIGKHHIAKKRFGLFPDLVRMDFENPTLGGLVQITYDVALWAQEE